MSSADLSSAGWIPKIPNIHQAIYDAAKCEGALDMGSWHEGGNFCGTTHCRAGWVTHLAGEGGRVMEGLMSTPTAAALIYMASDPTLGKIPDFYCDNEAALEDMKRMADELRRRVEKRGDPWEAQDATTYLNKFLSLADSDPWLSANFLPSNLLSQFDKVINYGKQQRANSNPGNKQRTGSPEQFASILNKINNMPEF